MPTADSRLLERWISQRDSEAFHELVQRHAGLVLGVCRRILGNAADSEDVAQECFFELARTRRPPRTSVPGWLHALATHRSFDHIKANVRRRRREETANELRRAESDSEWQRIRPHLDEAIDRLPAHLRQVVVARFLEQKTQRVVAEELGLSRQTVTHRVRQAIDRIRRHFERCGIAVGGAVLTAALVERVAADVPPSLVAALGKIPLARLAAATASTAASSGIVKGALLTMTTTKLWTAAGAAAALLLLFALIFSLTGWSRWDFSGDEPAAVPGSNPVAAPQASADDEGEEELAAVDEQIEEPAPAANDPDRTLRGRVLDPTGAPVANARVAAAPARQRPLAESTTGTDGRFEVTLPEPGDYVVRAFHSAAGLAPAVSATTGGADVELVLAPFAVLGGRVIDKSSGEPIEEIGLSVDFFGVESAEISHALGCFGVDRRWRLESLEDGRYRFDGLPAGKYHINFEPGAGGYAVPGYFGVRYLEIILVPGEVRLDFDIALARGGAISGRVLDPSGRPLADARINVTSTLHTFRDRPSMRTDAEGRYRVAGLAVGGDYLIVADHEPFAQAYSESITVSAAEEISGVDVQLVEGRTVAGRVVDESGSGVAKARVSLSRDFGRSLYGFGRRPVHTDSTGTFAFENVAPGPYNLIVRAEGFDDNRVHKVEVSAVATEEGPEIVVVLGGRRAPGVVAGRITDRDGRPLQGVRVLLHSQTRGVHLDRGERTDEDGRYRFEGVGNAERFRVSVYPGGYTPAERKGVVLGSEDVDFVLVRPGSVAGRVVDASTGQPVKQFEVRTISYRRDERRGYADDWIPIRHENGEFLLDDVEPPSSSIGVRAPGYSPLQSERLEIEPETVVELELALQAGAIFSGRVVDTASGRPIAGARVRIHDRDSFHSSLLRDQYGFSEGKIGGLEVTGDDGRFAFRALPPGELFDAVVWHAGHGTRVLPRLRAPKELEVALEAEAGLVVEIREQGAPVEGVAVSIERAGDEDTRRHFRTGRTTDRSGRVELAGLPSGRFTLQLHRHPRPTLAFLERELEPGETLRLTFDLGELARTTGAVRGAVVGLSGRATVWIQPKESSARFGIEGCSSEEPSFEFPGLPPGSYVLHVLGGKGRMEQPIEVLAGVAVEVTVDVEAGVVR